MFYSSEKDKDKNLNKIETLIGDNCHVEGNLSGEGLLKINGYIHGNINWDDDILLDMVSYCEGNITCKNAFLNGKVKGNVFCSDTLTIEANGKIFGDITTKNLSIIPGGLLDGKCTMILGENSEDKITEQK